MELRPIFFSEVELVLFQSFPSPTLDKKWWWENRLVHTFYSRAGAPNEMLKASSSIRNQLVESISLEYNRYVRRHNTTLNNITKGVGELGL